MFSITQSGIQRSAIIHIYQARIYNDNNANNNNYNMVTGKIMMMMVVIIAIIIVDNFIDYRILRYTESSVCTFTIVADVHLCI